MKVHQWIGVFFFFLQNRFKEFSTKARKKQPASTCLVRSLTVVTASDLSDPQFYQTLLGEGDTACIMSHIHILEDLSIKFADWKRIIMVRESVRHMHNWSKAPVDLLPVGSNQTLEDAERSLLA